VEAVHAFARAAGREAEIIRVPRGLIARAGGDAFKSPLYFGEYYDVPPITMITGRVKRVFNMSLTPFAEGLKETYKWYLRHETRKPDFRLDDVLIRQVREPVRASG
jgi:hypothetical protein